MFCPIWVYYDYGYIGPYAYVMSHMHILMYVWDFQMHMGRPIVPYMYNTY